MKKSVTSITLMAAGVLGLASVSGSAGAATLDGTDAVFEFGVDGQTVTNAGDLGETLSLGSSIRYSNVATVGGTVIDAVVTFVSCTNMNFDEIAQLDDDEDSPFIESNIEADSNSIEATAEIRVDFLAGGTDTPLTISNLSLNVYDIDALQWVEMGGVAGYSVATNTHLTVTNPSPGTYRFTSPDAGTDSDDGTAFTVGRARVIFAAASSVTYRIAGMESAAFDADFSNGLPWTDNSGGGEDTSNLPAPELPSTGAAAGVLAGIAVAMIAGGATLGARRRTRA